MTIPCSPMQPPSTDDVISELTNLHHRLPLALRGCNKFPVLHLRYVIKHPAFPLRAPLYHTIFLLSCSLVCWFDHPACSTANATASFENSFMCY